MMNNVSLASLKENLAEIISKEFDSAFLKINEDKYKVLADLYDISGLEGIEYEPCVHITSKELFKSVMSTEVKWNFDNGINIEKIYTNIHLPPGEKVIDIKFHDTKIKHPGHNSGEMIKYHFILFTTYGRFFTSLPYSINNSMGQNRTYGWYSIKDGSFMGHDSWGNAKVNPAITIEEAPILTHRTPAWFWQVLRAFEKQDTSTLQGANQEFYDYIGKWNNYITQEIEIDVESLRNKIEDQKTCLSQYETTKRELELEISEKNERIKNLEEENKILIEKANKYDKIYDFPEVIAKYMKICFKSFNKEVHDINKKDIEEFLETIYNLLREYKREIEQYENEMKEIKIYMKKKEEFNGTSKLRSDMYKYKDDIKDSVDDIQTSLQEILRKR